MDWQEIYDTIYEIQLLQEECKIKIKNPAISSIVKRFNEYIVPGKDLYSYSLNNASLENKIKNTKIQVAMINKINELSLSNNIEAICNSLPEDLKDCKEYVNDLKNKYELANKCYRLVLEIESLSEIEYQQEYSFEDSEYAKMINYSNELYYRIINQHELYNEEYLEEKLAEYCETLSSYQIQNLYIEYLSLSYDRNSFDYFNEIKTSFNMIRKLENVTMGEAIALYKQYNLIIKDCLNSMYIYSKSLSDIYQELGLIHNSTSVTKLLKINNSKK